ncbi:DUF2059 domain-containing protein [Aquimarina agarivorans]|uniref:DUF2059 domain-containing protein n=1 Tax=Aquimarina agarivorans TaxID=980584 RepID=UPI000248FCBC|nr:DUF2059 domain-containing protein [Aquimarina agarivorans]
MKNRFIGLVLFFIISLQSIAQQPTLTESVTQYLNINGTTEQYEHAVSSLLVMLKQQYASKNVPDTVWDELSQHKPTAINQIKAMLVSAYRSHFDQVEINDMIDFYKTPTGQQMIKDQTKLTQEDRDKMSFFYNSPTGKKILDESDALNKSVSEISENWSRGLYKSMTALLAEKGYVL